MSKKNFGTSVRLITKLSTKEELKGTHCVVEWEEEGNPRGVVQRKKLIDPGTIKIGQRYKVQLVERGKTVVYHAKLLACGKFFVLYC